MATKRTKKGESSRTRLLEAATRQFSEKGYHSTKVSDIVQAAGLTQAAFYLYFSSKEAIFSELVNEYRMKVKVLADAGKLATPLVSADVPKQAKENLQNLLLFFNTSPQLAKIALFESPEGEGIKREIIAMIAQNLQNNQNAGHIRKDLPIEVAAECMVAVVERMVKKMIDDEADPIKLANGIADVLLYGILADK